MYVSSVVKYMIGHLTVVLANYNLVLISTQGVLIFNNGYITAKLLKLVFT